MNKYKYLLKNIGVLTVANFGTKLLNFFLVPLYTSILSTEEYGTYDLLTNTVSLIIPIFTLNVSESVLRFCLDKRYKKENILNVATKCYSVGFLVLVVLTIINWISGFFSLLNTYVVEFILMYVVYSLIGILTSYARGIEKITDVAVSGILSASATIVLNILFLMVLNWGLEGYFLSVIIGSFAQIIYLIIKTNILRVAVRNFVDRRIEIEMLKYCLPLVVNSIAWWINSASDRYVITGLLGIQRNGIYSVAYKIPSLLTIVNVIFNQAWVISSVKEYDGNNSVRFYTNVYKIYNIVMVESCSLLILLDKPMALFLYKKDFFEAWQYVPFLLVSVLYGAMSGYIGVIFSTIKRTKVTANTVLLGAAINIVLDVLLVQMVGAIGAAIATMISYFIVWAVRYGAMIKYIRLDINILKDIFAYILLTIQSIVCVLVENSLISVTANLLAVSGISLLYFVDIRKILCKVFGGRI